MELVVMKQLGKSCVLKSFVRLFDFPETCWKFILDLPWRDFKPKENHSARIFTGKWKFRFDFMFP